MFITPGKILSADPMPYNFLVLACNGTHLLCVLLPHRQTEWYFHSSFGVSIVGSLLRCAFKLLNQFSIAAVPCLYGGKQGNKLKYSAFQRRTESLSKRNCKILRTEKPKNDIIERETALSNANSKTVNYNKWINKAYLVENYAHSIIKSWFYRR